MTVTVLEIATGRTFQKTFTSPYLAEKWMKKAKYSKEIRVIDVTYHNGIYMG